jgi:hypothetical protein
MQLVACAEAGEQAAVAGLWPPDEYGPPIPGCLRELHFVLREVLSTMGGSAIAALLHPTLLFPIPEVHY